MPILAHCDLIDRQKKVPAFFYALPSGREPVREWILSLSRDDRTRLGKDIQKVEYGWPLGMPYCRSLGQSLWEVRTDLTGGRIARVIFAVLLQKMVLLHGFIKKTQKTPETDLKLALDRLKEVMRDA